MFLLKDESTPRLDANFQRRILQRTAISQFALSTSLNKSILIIYISQGTVGLTIKVWDDDAGITGGDDFLGSLTHNIDPKDLKPGDTMWQPESISDKTVS